MHAQRTTQISPCHMPVGWGHIARLCCTPKRTWPGLLAGTPSAFTGSVRGMRYDPITKALILATNSSIAICKDAKNTAGIGDCVVDSAGGLLAQPFDVWAKDDTLWSEYRVGGLSWRIALPAQPASLQAVLAVFLHMGAAGHCSCGPAGCASVCPTGAVMCAC